MFKNILTLLLVLFSPAFLFAQTETGMWTTISLEKELSKKWELGAEAEFRTVGGNDVRFVRLLERTSLGLSADYTILKGWKIGAGYQIMNKLDTKYLNYQWRNRFNVSTTGRVKYKDFTFSLRERIQFTTKDESKRIERDDAGNVKYLSDGSVNIDHYKINPELKWRNRLQVSYNIPRCKMTPTFSVESNFQLNNPDGNHFDKFRYVMTLGYKVKKIHLIELFGVLNDEYDPEDASAIGDLEDDVYGKYNVGVGYKFSF
ncbi:MAG: DUF2490 domain-containing protein [Paludibacteraceae bacterium]|nr:DUF2490 domain-containing protein [Paludibacteraceae bacterium]